MLVQKMLVEQLVERAQRSRLKKGALIVHSLN